MLLDLRGFRGGEDELARQYQPDAFNLAGEDFRVIAPVDLAAKVTKDARKVRLVGRLKTTLETDCGRCLEPFTVAVDAPLDLMFLPEEPAVGDPAAKNADDDVELEVRADDVGVTFYKGDAIDLAEVMREQFYLAMPMKPLCKPDCQGLCPVCGGNRNRERCACRADWVDPRMEPLKKLLDK
jgi:uncharacterized protein